MSERTDFIVKVFEKYIPKDSSILEIGGGDGRNIIALQSAGYHNTAWVDKESGGSIEDIFPVPEDVIFTMSCLFLIPKGNEWVFEKIAKMAKKYLITVEGETTKGNGVIGRDYQQVFEPFGFKQIEHQTNVFNMYGVLRVFKKCKK